MLKIKTIRAANIEAVINSLLAKINSSILDKIIKKMHQLLNSS